ncbi:MAG: hypothetical protein LBC87_12835 [Fibromonadaceae bacterium]|jgi:hypothetical protein|nr:hypothetical protein [Fibromonadaceae bacterium]
MQKKLRSLFIVASLSLAASLVIVACGDGIPDILADFRQNVDVSENEMKDKIGDVMEKSPEPPPPPVSSEAPPNPGSSAAPPNPGSSAAPPNPGSSAAPNPGSSAGGTSSAAAPSSSSTPKSSAVAATGKCRENPNSNTPPKAGFTCGWEGYSATKILTPGTKLKPAAHTLPSGCTSVNWNFAPDTSGMIINNACSALPAAGESALGSSRYVLFAELECDDGKHINACDPKTGWSSQPAPVFSDKSRCEWEKNPTTTARGGTPKKGTIEVVDAANPKICGNNPTIVYKYDGGKDWPATGILPEWKNWKRPKSETYNIEAVLNCPAYSQTVSLACPPLEVNAGSDYIIECTGDWNAAACGNKNSATLKQDECVEINVLGLDKSHQVGVDLVMRCQAAGSENEASVSYTLSLNGGTGVKCTGSYSCNNTVPIGKTKSGDNEFGTLCLTQLAGKSSVKCDFGQ